MTNRVWITWETQRRNYELAKAFKAQYFAFDFSNLPMVLRYIKSSISTLVELSRMPNIVFAQCPSLVLCLEVSILKYLFRYKLIIDAHNSILDYIQSENLVIRLIAKFTLKTCDYLILTNNGLADIVNLDRDKVLILPDKLPKIEINKNKPSFFSDQYLNIVFICSFASDEPLEEFLKAADKLKEKCRFFITGKKSKAKDLLRYESENIIFTDFLTEQDYEQLISNSDLNIDLTTEDNLLVCGAYETLAVSVPGILSDTSITREIFKRGFVYTKCDSESIISSVNQASLNLEELGKQVSSYKSEFEVSWDHYFLNCEKKLS